MFCKHEWKVVSETTTVSKFESSMKAATKNNSRPSNLPFQLCCADRKHIQVIACDKCGKLNRFVENI